MRFNINFGAEISVTEHSNGCPAFERVLSFAVVCLVVFQIAVRAEAQQLHFPDTTWDTATPESVWMDSGKLNAAVGSLSNPEETMVIQNGRVIWQGNNIHSQQHVWSVTKTYASTALGLLIDDHTVNLDTRVSEYVPAMEMDYADATLRHFVTQTSGYVANGETIPLDLSEPEDPYAPGTPLFTPSGSQFAYTGAAMDMFAHTLALAAGQPLQELFTSRIADPIKMQADSWDWRGFETQDGVQVDGGSGYRDKGMSISAANAGRLGLLFLARGNWDGEQLLSSDWIDAATQVQVPSTLPLHPQSATPGPGQYGFGWWVSSGGWYEAIGFQNNYISVNPSSGTVVVSLGTESGGNSNFDSFKAQLGQAVTPAIWDGRGDGDWTELDPITGKPRWITEDGMNPDVYPTANSMIHSNKVTVNDFLRVGTVDVNNGAIHVAETSDFRAHGRIQILQNSELLVEGSAVVGRLDIEDQSSLVVDGSFSADALYVSDSTIVIRDTQKPVEVDSRFRLSGDSELRFVMSDEEWGSTIELATRRAKPSLSGKLVLEVNPELDPKQLVGKSISLFDWIEGAEPTTEFQQVVHPERLQIDLSQLYSQGDISVISVLEKPITAGDFNVDALVDITDIDSLSARIRIGSQDTYFDLNDDMQVTAADLVVLIESLLRTSLGDANLDGTTDFDDFLVLSANFGEAGGWVEGDFDGDGQVQFSDFLALSNNFGNAGNASTRAAPEPTGVCLMTFSIFVGLGNRRRRLYQSGRAWQAYVG